MFYIYGKHKAQRTFRPMNINAGIQVQQLIRATRLTKQEKDKFLQVEAPRNAPEWAFEARPIEVEGAAPTAADTGGDPALRSAHHKSAECNE